METFVGEQSSKENLLKDRIKQPLCLRESVKLPRRDVHVFIPAEMVWAETAFTAPCPSQGPGTGGLAP